MLIHNPQEINLLKVDIDILSVAGVAGCILAILAGQKGSLFHQ